MLVQVCSTPFFCSLVSRSKDQPWTYFASLRFLGGQITVNASYFDRRLMISIRHRHNWIKCFNTNLLAKKNKIAPKLFAYVSTQSFKCDWLHFDAFVRCMDLLYMYINIRYYFHKDIIIIVLHAIVLIVTSVLEHGQISSVSRIVGTTVCDGVCLSVAGSSLRHYAAWVALFCYILRSLEKCLEI